MAFDYLACPKCGVGLAPDETVYVRDGSPQHHVVCTGGCGSYPVQDGVPRLLPELTERTATGAEHQLDTGRAFGSQWDLYEYGNTTWGITLEERIQVVLHELQWTEAELEGKVILDAGCGNGTLSKAIADLGATVVALDLSDSVFRAQRHRPSPRVQYVQGNLFFPPLKPGVFDAIYSCGVFHHTPDTRRCFDALVPTLKQNADALYFVWLYSPRAWLFNITVEPLMHLARRMPSSVLVPMCRALSPPVEAGSRVMTKLGAVEDAPRNLKDRAVQLHDLLSPPFVWYHRYEEAQEWAEKQGFQDITRTQYSVSANHADDLAPVLEKYRKICRPGFGILCRNRETAPASIP